MMIIHLFDGVVLVDVGESKPTRSLAVLVRNPTLLLQDGTFIQKSKKKDQQTFNIKKYTHTWYYDEQ